MECIQSVPSRPIFMIFFKDLKKISSLSISYQYHNKIQGKQDTLVFLYSESNQTYLNQE